MLKGRAREWRRKMQKTKLGLSVGLVGAGLYFLGLFSFTPAFLLAAYVLLREDNEWLKKAAVKMVAVLLVFYLLGLAVSCIDEVFSIINVFVSWGGGSTVRVPLRLTDLLDYILWFAKVIVMAMLGFKALRLGSVAVGPVDKIVDSNM